MSSLRFTSSGPEIPPALTTGSSPATRCNTRLSVRLAAILAEADWPTRPQCVPTESEAHPEQAAVW